MKLTNGMVNSKNLKLIWRKILTQHGVQKKLINLDSKRKDQCTLVLKLYVVAFLYDTL